jgi:non-specific serine/threonine protein kinase
MTSPPPLDSELGAHLAGAMWHFWQQRGHLQEGRPVLDLALATPPTQLTPSNRSRTLDTRTLVLLGAISWAAFPSDLRTAAAYAEVALALARDAGDHQRTMYALQHLGFYRVHLGDHDEARRLCDESIGIARHEGPPDALVTSLLNAANTAVVLTEYARAVAFCEEGLALLRSRVEDAVEGNLLRTLSRAVHGLGDRERAVRLAEESLAISRTHGHMHGIGESHDILGRFALLDGDLEQAVAMLRASVELYHEIGERWQMVWTLHRVVGTEALRGERAAHVHAKGGPASATAQQHDLDAARLIGATDALRAQSGRQGVPELRRVYDRHVAAVRERLGKTAFEQACGEGQTMSFEQAVSFARRLLGAPITNALTTSDQSAVPDRHPSSPDPEIARLTTREREVVILVARGLANRQIAERLTLTRRTVETHVHNVLGKLGLTSRSQLAVWAVEHGLVTLTTHEC